MRGICFDIGALVYGPMGAEFLTEVLRGEGIQAEQAEVEDALARLPGELQALKAAIRTEEQENDYNRAMLALLVTELGVPNVTDALLLRLAETVHEYHAYFSMYPETLPVLEELKSRGLPMAVVANWAPSLGRLLREFALEGYFSAVLPSAAVGLSKPDPYIFHQALKALGVRPEEAAHVGPSLAEDITGALRAGITPVWLNRAAIPTGQEVLTISDLRGLLMLAPKAGDPMCS
ncbi:MAG TPA: HAD family hydrolase [Symbiobacteriaceae bacterium]|nr:HAD family hydrolase [Symbiobacteriaceae bacterium]